MKRSQRGFTVLEAVITIIVATTVVTLASSLFYQAWKYWRLNQFQITAQDQTRSALNMLLAELREAQSADNGAYALESVGPYSLIFYSNVDADANKEHVRYFLDGTDFKKGVIDPVGVPATYPPQNEVVRFIASDIRNITPLFYYHPDSYTGTEDPLPNPVAINEVRLVRIHIIIDANVDEHPAATELETAVSLRNLKDNLDD